MEAPSWSVPVGAEPKHADQPLASANLQAALVLLDALIEGGLAALVVCPGSRSAPLAQAAALLEARGLRVVTALDERSAGFWALGHSRASGRLSGVVTTSGTAVANLLPAAVEADMGSVPLVLLSADRPARLKGCGANQTVNQDCFLRASVRWLGEGDPKGLACMAEQELQQLARCAVAAAAGAAGGPAGPVHLNLAFDEPLHSEVDQWQQLQQQWSLPPRVHRHDPPGPTCADATPPATTAAMTGPGALDPDQPGVVVAGPWRGRPQQWPEHLMSLRRWLLRSGWPLLADGLSGLRGQPDLQAIGGYDLLLAQPPRQLQAPQVLRLGPLPASRRLQQWLAASGGRQVLISEGEPRPLDPLGTVAAQHPHGLAAWCGAQPQQLWQGQPAANSLALRQAWHQADTTVQQLLDQQLLHPQPAATATANEPALSRLLSRLLPPGLPLMLANSSPVRDWESFADPSAPPRPVLGFRGASGIDGTLSLACGVAEALGQAVLLTGDLALLHDSNGWLWRTQLRGRLAVVLINNGGGGIFEQLAIRHPAGSGMDFERLFAMPQAVDGAQLCGAYGVPHRHLTEPEGLPGDLEWLLQQPLGVLEIRTDRGADAGLRRRLRTMAQQLPAER
jgi:2-succinyl-5-enolpyruvyl-6-hydroxy-3-cyclohexene-1-carboxylate synthase